MACVTKWHSASLFSRIAAGYNSYTRCLSTLTPHLAFEEFHSGGVDWTQEPKTALILHGLLGQGRNWRSFAKTLASSLAQKGGTSWKVLTLDLRSHPDLVLGHSMGGKVGMEYVKVRAELHHASQGKPQNVWILDSQPGKVGPDLMPDVTRVLQAVKLINMPVSDRARVLAELRQQGFSEALVLWMVSNLVPQAGKPAPQPLVWAFDVKGAADLYEDYKKVDAWDLLRSPPSGTTMNILRAEQSDRWTEDMIQTLVECAAAAQLNSQENEHRGSTKLHLLPDAGHWVHMDNPKGLMNMILDSVR